MADIDPSLRPPIELGEGVVLAMEAIQKLNTADVPRVPEGIFTQHILPIMTDRSGKVDISAWLDIAGNAQRPIDVIDLRGQVLFRVPAMMRQLPTKTSSSHRASITELASTAKLKGEVHPGLGQNFLAQGLSRHVPRLGTQVDLESAKAWNAILKRYGYPSIFPEDVADAVGEPKALTSEVKEEKSIFLDEDDEA